MNTLIFIRTRLLVFLPTLLGLIETAMKFIKELLTLIVDILYPIIPNKNFKAIVSGMRALITAIYDWISKNKESLLAYLKL